MPKDGVTVWQGVSTTTIPYPHVPKPTGKSLTDPDKDLVAKDPDEVQVGGDHYKKMKIQPTEYIISNGLNFAEGNIVKYATRHKTKGGAEDIKKLIHYGQLILKHEYGIK